MRLRTVFLVLAVVVVGVLALLNATEITRQVPVNLLWAHVEAPLGLVLVGLLAAAVAISLSAGATLRGRHRHREQELSQGMQTQRDLTQRAEASHFSELRQTLDNLLRDTRQRDAKLSGSVEQSLVRHQRETRTQLEGLHRAMGSRLGEMEARLEARLDGIAPSRSGWTSNGPAAAATQGTGESAAWAEPVTASEVSTALSGGPMERS